LTSTKKKKLNLELDGTPSVVYITDSPDKKARTRNEIKKFSAFQHSTLQTLEEKHMKSKLALKFNSMLQRNNFATLNPKSKFLGALTGKKFNGRRPSKGLNLSEKMSNTQASLKTSMLTSTVKGSLIKPVLGSGIWSSKVSILFNKNK